MLPRHIKYITNNEKLVAVRTLVVRKREEPDADFKKVTEVYFKNTEQEQKAWLSRLS